MRPRLTWRDLPSDLPAWQSVYYHFDKWREQGMWKKINKRLRRRLRKRAGKKPSTTSERPPPETVAEQAAALQIHLLDVLWSRLEPLLPTVGRVGRPYNYDRRLVLEAIHYVMQTDCGWRNLPAHFPPWQTVYAQLSQWQRTGIWKKIWEGLEQS